MSLVIESIQKAVQRSQALDLQALRQRVASRRPQHLVTAAALEERRRFLLQTAETTADADAAFERIIQGDELQDVNYLPRGSRAARSIGRIWIRQPNGIREGYGTGFLIGERVLITNNHVLPSSQMAQRSEVEFEYEFNEDGEMQQGVKFQLDPGALFHTSTQLDFSVVGVSPRALNAERTLAEFGRLPLIGSTGKVLEGEWLTIIQHPRGEPKQICVRENQLLKRDTDVLWYSTDTQEGSSGSPVFNNDWLVVALHHCGVPEIKNNKWQTLDGHDFDSRIHRPEDIHWIANEGIRVSRIVETLQRDLASHPLIQAVLHVSPTELTAPRAPAPPSTPATHPATSSLQPAAPTPPVMNPPLPTAPAALAGRQFILSFDAAGNPALTPGPGAHTTESFGTLAEKAAAATAAAKAKSKSTGSTKAQPKGVPFKFDSDYSTRAGFDVDFLSKDPELQSGKDKARYRVHLPRLAPALAASAVRLLEPEGTKDTLLHYQGMSLVMHGRRRFAIYSAANVDYAGRMAGLSSQRVWKYDPRIPFEAQLGPQGYDHNQFDKGHLTRQEDMEYGSTIQERLQSTADTCHWTNCTPQHAKFNRTAKWWQGLEQHILEHSVKPEAKGFRAQIITGPVLAETDPVFAILPGVQIPMKFWKVAVAVTSSGRLFAVAYLVDQTPVIQQYGVTEAAGETPFAPYRLFQLPIAELEDMIHLKFTYGPGPKPRPLSECDPLKDGPPPKLDADQDGKDDRKESLRLQDEDEDPEIPRTWVDVNQRPPYFGK